MKANIIVGLGYGDEGKGITTDYIANNIENSKGAIVIRFSGGPQAGHTVIANGKKHVHSSFGSATLRHNIPTYFSEHTLIYPNAINKEIGYLNRLGVHDPILVIHPLAKLITPFDIFKNRMDTENLRHGTCGMGIGASMKRQNETPFKFYAVDLMAPDLLYEKLSSYGKSINFNYTPEAITEFKLFFKIIDSIKWNIFNYDYLMNKENLIFEGSQGILLDMDHGIFPYVTYANTTSKNALAICDKIGVTDPKINYITRAYSTRHGNGPYKEEEINLKNNKEEININNTFQGRFKKSNINYGLLHHALRIDHIYSSNKYYKNLIVTCLDQMPKKFKFRYDKLGMSFINIYESYGPDSINFKKIK